MKRTIITAALACLGIAAASANEPAATLFLARDGTPVIRYSVSGATSEGRFADAASETHAVAREKFWSYDRECFDLQARGLRKRAEKCGAAEVRLSWDEQARDRTYPGVVRLRNGGVLVATRYLQPLGNDGRLVDWMARAPEGGVVVFRGEKSRTSITLGDRYFAEDGRGYVYLGPDDFRETPVGRAFVDRDVPAALADEVLRLGPALLAEVGRRLGAAPKHRPSLFLTWVNREGRGRQHQADVVPGAVIRFGLSGADWGAAHPDTVPTMRKVLAHEMLHFWNGELFQPTSWAAPWVIEGNAELLSVAALSAVGETTPQEAAQFVGSAITECLLLARGRSWTDMYHYEKHFGRGPYACGLALQFAALAAAAKTDARIDAFELWKRIWAGHPRYFEAVLQSYFQRSGQASLAQQFGAMLTDKSAPLADGLRKILADAGLEVAATPPTPADYNVLRRQLVGALMQTDCQGNVSFFTHDDRYEIVEGTEILCKTFRKGQVIRSVEGDNPFEKTLEVIAKANAACKSRGVVRLEADDGSEIAAPCPPAPFADEGALVRLDPRAVAALLARPKP